MLDENVFLSDIGELDVLHFNAAEPGVDDDIVPDLGRGLLELGPAVDVGIADIQLVHVGVEILDDIDFVIGRLLVEPEGVTAQATARTATRRNAAARCLRR